MTKRKKKSAIKLISLLFTLVILIGVYVWYSTQKAVPDDAEDTVSESISLVTLDTTKITALHYIGEDIDINLVLKDGLWISSDEPDRPINQDNVASMLNNFSNITADKMVVEAPENLADFGFDSPFASLQATLEDGTITTLKLGDLVLSGDGYYALVNDDNKVYILPTSYGVSFSDLDMTAIAVAPTITAENITYINIDSRDGEDYELKYNENVVQDNSGANLYNWEILKPYGVGYTADSTAISTLQSNYTSFNYLACVDYKGDDLSQYGLDNPAATIDIGYYESATQTEPTANSNTSDTSENSTNTVDKEYKIYIGNLDESGNYYVRVDGSNAVYTLSSDTVNTMLQVDAFSMMNKSISIPSIENVDKISAKIDGVQYEMEIRRTVTNADGAEGTQSTYFYNGKEENEDLFKSVYETMIGASYDSELKDEVETSAIVPYMTLSYHIIGNYETTITASYLPYNDSFYIVDKGDGRYFLADKRVIDQIANVITTFTGTAEQSE